MLCPVDRPVNVRVNVMFLGGRLYGIVHFVGALDGFLHRAVGACRDAHQQSREIGRAHV